MSLLSKKVISHWYISYDPYTDVFQMYDSKALELGRTQLMQTKFKSALVFADKNNTPHLFELTNAYSKLGDIDNMDKTSIINKVTGYLSNHGQ